MQNYPIFMRINRQPCLVVGAGGVALRKIRLLDKAGARITVIAPAISAEIRAEFADTLDYQQREFSDADIEGFRLIIVATDQPAVNQRVSALAQARNVPVNVVDQPELCSFITPSMIDRSPVQIAISTGGGAPVLARTLRSKIESMLPANYGNLATAMSKYRALLKQHLPNEDQRRKFWDKVIQGPIAELFLQGKSEHGEAALQAAISTDQSTMPQGAVWLIGAGPGDPDLLTFRALRLMQQADVVLYDRLVSPEILDLTRRDAQRLYVGKQRANHAVAQNQINQLLLDLAQQGKTVVRLKGGDPFIFGRGGEEIELLSQADIPFQIVPGITAASGCACYAGIPLTHRDFAQSCLFVTGHLKNGTVDLNWQALATPNQTVVIYMGLVGLPIICQQLIQHGVAKTMPIALIEQGTTQRQRVFTGTLATLAENIAQEKIQAPTLIIIGEVVQLHDSLTWYHPSPVD